MSDPLIEQRLMRIEAAQTDLLTRLGRLEAGTPQGPVERRERADTGPNWRFWGLFALGAVVVIWVLDEMPGPAIWDRLF
jgi:hypothetical protein